MAIVIASDLGAANSNNMSNIESVVSMASKLSSQIDSFNSDSKSKLVGGGFDAVRTKLDLYKNVAEAMKTIGTNLMSNIKNANNSMLNYMEGYAELDDSKIGEITSRLTQISGYINYLKSASKDGTDYSSLIAYWEGIYAELSHYKQLLEGLAGTDAGLYGALGNVIEDVANIFRSADGINVKTFTQDGFKGMAGKMYNFDPNLNVFGYTIDTANMSEQAKQWLAALEENWPDGMEEQRLQAIQTALSLLDKGITYSQPGRHAIDKKTGMPISMDCSSFVTYCLRSAGQDIPAGAYTGTYLSSKTTQFQDVAYNDLIPGDVALYNTNSAGGSVNHIGLYVGKDSAGNNIWIECSGGGIKIGKNNGFKVCKRYNQYTN